MKDSKYEEALERAKQGLPIDKIFPELKESEDERIRKELIDYLAHRADVTAFIDEGEDCKRWIAYLEKQKEQKHAEQLDGTFTSYDMAKTFMEGQNYVLAHPEKFGLCKPAEWSEEDKKIIGRLRSIVNECAFRNDALDVNGDYCEGDYGELDNWLNSLRPQPHWKPSQEQMIELMHAISGCSFETPVLESLYEQLKSL